MPFYKKFQINAETELRLENHRTQLNFKLLSLQHSINRLNGMKSESHQSCSDKLLQHLNYSDFDLTYDVTGKPNLTKITPLYFYFALCTFSAIGISTKPIGIDLEKATQKILTIASNLSITTKRKDEQKNIRELTVTWELKKQYFKIEISRN
jgi:hypothetical protein